MNKYYKDLSNYIESFVIPYLLAHEIIYLHKNNCLDISFLRLTNKIKKVINITNINYSKIKHITYNILLTKYNYKITNYYPIKLSYVIKQ